MTWRIRERSAFRRLSAEGRRARAGALWCTFVLDPTLTPPRVAFAFGRALGPAVVRNRLRRRLRHLLTASSLPPGLYLFGARSGDGSRLSSELEFDLRSLLERISIRAAS
ncbi:MAG: ribonuclease P protein component [Ilumatobacteraceae bacterium]